MPTIRRTAAALLAALITAPAAADEGMWLVNDPPLDLIEARHGVRLSQDWLDKAMRAAVRFENGGSGSFVSPHGLVMTNHHVAFDQIYKLSTPERDLVEDGFIARDPSEELPLPDLELRSLLSIEDVTDRVNDAVPEGAPAAAARRARQAAIAQLEAAHTNEDDRTVAQVVTLYGGGRYHLYTYRRYTDLRLVFAPPADVAAFGGDVDNFEFPRFCLDVTLVRAYENGRPVAPEHHLTLTEEGLEPGQPVFVLGHPGSTQRLYTAAHLEFLRDVRYPAAMDRIYRREVELRTFSEESPENARIATDDLLGIQNARKGLGGKLAALQNPADFARKRAEEAEFQARVLAEADDPAEALKPWTDIAAAQQTHRQFFHRRMAVGSAMNGSRLFDFALTLARLAEESAKPEAERLPEFSEANRQSLELELFSEAPIYPELERHRIRTWLESAASALGADDPLLAAILQGRSAADAARELVESTNLADPGIRREIARAAAEAGPNAVATNSDPLVQLARVYDPYARRLRERYEDEVLAVERTAYARLADLRFRAFGAGVYPDATFTLRLAVGQVQGYEQEGEPIEPFTTLAGMYERSEARGAAEPFDLPQLWLERRDALDLSTPYNFVSTNDIIGGNSGSPVLNADGDCVGLIFDGNRYSFAWDTIFSDEHGRAVSVDVRAILESLRAVYDAHALADELTGR